MTKPFHLLTSLFLGIPLLLAQCTLLGPRPGETVDRPITVPFCELIRNPSRFNNKIVRTEAPYSWNRENESFHDSKCGDEYVWVEYEDSYALVDDPMKQRFKQMPCTSTGLCEARVSCTGLFQSTGGPYGHLDGYKFRFRIMHIESVEAPPISQRTPGR